MPVHFTIDAYYELAKYIKDKVWLGAESRMRAPPALTHARQGHHHRLLARGRVSNCVAGGWPAVSDPKLRRHALKSTCSLSPPSDLTDGMRFFCFPLARRRRRYFSRTTRASATPSMGPCTGTSAQPSPRLRRTTYRLLTPRVSVRLIVFRCPQLRAVFADHSPLYKRAYSFRTSHNARNRLSVLTFVCSGCLGAAVPSQNQN